MKNKKLISWGNNLLDGLNTKWNNVPESILAGFTIFYSPIRFRPNLLLVGDNPGGDELVRQEKLPVEHEYFKYNYAIAYAMKNKIFTGERLNHLLKDSVKTNRIFFKTKNLKQFNELIDSKNMESYCFEILEGIIKVLEPKLIFAESLGTFRKLSNEERIILKKEENNKSLLVLGNYNEIPVLGINHPSRASFHKINDQDWKKVNEKLNEIL